MPANTQHTVPGTVVHHVPARTRQYVGCPSIVVLPDGAYLASHSYFGPGATNTDTFVYRSDDRGASWRRIAELHEQIWSNLFIHRGALYIMGTDHCDRYGGRLNGRVVIRRSDDWGESWTTPTDPSNGLLFDEDGYHTAPVPVVVHDGRLFRAMEFAPTPDRRTWLAFVLAADADSDLLDRRSWRASERYEHLWSESQWIEGNVVVAPEGHVVDVLRTNGGGNDTFAQTELKDKAILLHVSEDGRTLFHDRKGDLVDMPGGGVKFTIRYDEASQRYWTLSNKQRDPDAVRNRLFLCSSADLRHWTVHEELLCHLDTATHAFQYVDWVSDGEDIVFVSRTAFDDDEGGAHNFHDANYLTFHRVEGFRSHAAG